MLPAGACKRRARDSRCRFRRMRFTDERFGDETAGKACPWIKVDDVSSDANALAGMRVGESREMENVPKYDATADAEA